MAAEAIEVWRIYLDENGKESEPVFRDIIILESKDVKRMIAKYGKVSRRIVIRPVEQ